MRGKVVPSTPKRKTMRITPAYAGKRTLLFTLNLDKWDHPRLCGEKSLAFSIVSTSRRITPAYAGKRS